MNDNRNLIIAILGTFVIIFGFHYFFEKPRQEARLKQTTTAESPQSDTALKSPLPEEGEKVIPREEYFSQSSDKRIEINTPALAGSLSSRGVLFDDLTLLRYKVSPEDLNKKIDLLSPEPTQRANLASFGWMARDKDVDVPMKETEWEVVSHHPLSSSPSQAVVLRWENKEGVIFENKVMVDENYMFTIHQTVINRSNKAIQLANFGRVERFYTPQHQNFWILHEGPLGLFDQSLEEINYEDMRDKRFFQKSSQGGWFGITNKYWLTALIPDQRQAVTTTFQYDHDQGRDHYSVHMQSPFVEIQPGSTYETKNRLFAGAKVVRILDNYTKTLNIPKFDLAVDFGLLYIITKPIFYCLDFFNQLLHNFGLSILLLTVLVKLLLFPISNKSYRSMSKMKRLHPIIKEFQERYSNDKVRLQQELMTLYKQEGVNPVSGCLPLLMQIPIFFALYKVLFITIEMRHAPFFGWVRDLSAPDPTNVFNLFGLIPWDPPSFLMIGAWPIIMGLTMLLQQRLNPQPADPIQAKVFYFLPILFTFLLARFAVGLVIYMAWNNILSFCQQWLIMRLEEREMAKKQLQAVQNRRKKKTLRG